MVTSIEPANSLNKNIRSYILNRGGLFSRRGIQHKERGNEQHAARRIRRRISKEVKRRGGNLDPSPAKKRMLLQDAPQKISEEGEEIMAIPALLDKQVVDIIKQWKRDIREKDTRNGDVQTLESMAGE